MLNQSLRLRYKIIKFLGSGRFGETYLAEDLDLPGKPYCVVKQFRRESQQSILQVEKAQASNTLEIWTVENNQAYIITYTATASQYNIFLEAAKEIFNFFEIL